MSASKQTDTQFHMLPIAVASMTVVPHVKKGVRAVCFL